VEFYLAPTTPRNKPYWYSSAQSSITRLIQLQLKELQPRLISLPGFPTDPTSLDTDGVHFSVLAGIAYCQHVVDSARLTPLLMIRTRIPDWASLAISLFPFSVTGNPLRNALYSFSVMVCHKKVCPLNPSNYCYLVLIVYFLISVSVCFCPFFPFQIAFTIPTFVDRFITIT
jgi:hypothetical protein